MEKYKAILAQHEELNVALDRLGVIALSRPGPLPARRMVRILGSELRSLGRMLVEPFAYEERGGYMEDVLEKGINLHSRVAELKGQHSALVAEVEALTARTLSGSNLELLKSDILKTLDLIMKHELDEGELIQKTMLEDIGVGE